MCLISDSQLVNPKCRIMCIIDFVALLLQQFYLYTLFSSLGINEADLHNPTMHLNFLNPFILDVQLFSFSLNSICTRPFIFLYYFFFSKSIKILYRHPFIKNQKYSFELLFSNCGQSLYTCRSILHKMTCNCISYDYNKCEINLLLKLSNTYPKLIHSV